MERFSNISDLELADGLVTWSGRIAAGEAELHCGDRGQPSKPGPVVVNAFAVVGMLVR